MRLTVGMLRQVIREEVERARRGRLYESMVDPEHPEHPEHAERAELKAVAALNRHTALDSDEIIKMSLGDCDAYGFPPGTLYCNVSNFDRDGNRLKKEPYLKFPGKGWAHEAHARA